MAAESRFAIFDQQIGFYQTIIPLALMAFESIPHSAFSLIGYWLRGYEGERNIIVKQLSLILYLLLFFCAQNITYLVKLYHSDINFALYIPAVKQFAIRRPLQTGNWTVMGPTYMHGLKLQIQVVNTKIILTAY